MASAPTEFTIFSSLPFELRTKIWEQALPGPRIVEIFVKEHLLPSARVKGVNTDLRSSEEKPSWPIFSWLFESSTMPPQEGEATEVNNANSDPEITYATSRPIPTPLLHTCSESRVLAQRHYALSFGTSSSPANIYFSPEHDTLYLPCCSFPDGSSAFLASTTSPATPSLAIQHIAFDLDVWYITDKIGYLNYQIEPLKWPHLKTVTFLLSKPKYIMDSERPATLGGIEFRELDESDVHAEQGDIEGNWMDSFMEDCERALEGMKGKQPGFRKSVVRFMALMRGGVRV